MKIKLIIIAMFAVVVAAPDVKCDETPLYGGFSKINITPSQPVMLAGYASRSELSTGIHDSLFARISAFQSGDTKLVFVSADIIDYYSGTSAIFRETLLDKFDLEPDELFLSAIHTHSAPRLTLDENKGHPNNIEYTKTLLAKLTSAIETALADKQPIKIGAGKGSSPVGVNRREVYYDEAGNPRMWIGRNPYGVQDKEVSVVKITDANDTLKIVLWEYAMHSTSLGPKNLQISGDVHGLAEQLIERYCGDGVLAPAFAGASGDIDPWYRVLPGFETKNGWIPEPVLMGHMLGEEVVHVLRDIKNTSSTGQISSKFETLELPGKPHGEIRTSTDYPTAPINITVARVGNVAFVGLGAEVLCEIGLAIKAASPFENTIIMTHCNGTADYISPQHAYNEGGYEVENSPFASWAADMLVKRVVRLLYEL